MCACLCVCVCVCVPVLVCTRVLPFCKSARAHTLIGVVVFSNSSELCCATSQPYQLTHSFVLQVVCKKEKEQYIHKGQLETSWCRYLEPVTMHSHLISGVWGRYPRPMLCMLDVLPAGPAPGGFSWGLPCRLPLAFLLRAAAVWLGLWGFGCLLGAAGCGCARVCVCGWVFGCVCSCVVWLLASSCFPRPVFFPGGCLRLSCVASRCCLLGGAVGVSLGPCGLLACPVVGGCPLSCLAPRAPSPPTTNCVLWSAWSRHLVFFPQVPVYLRLLSRISPPPQLPPGSLNPTHTPTLTYTSHLRLLGTLVGARRRARSSPRSRQVGSAVW